MGKFNIPGLLLVGVVLFVLIAILYGNTQGLISVPLSWLLQLAFVLSIAIVCYYFGRWQARSDFAPVAYPGPKDPCWASLSDAWHSHGPLAIQRFIENHVPGDAAKSFEERIYILLRDKTYANRVKIDWMKDLIYPNGGVGDLSTFDITIWAYLIGPAVLKIPCTFACVHDLREFRNNLVHSRSQPLSDADCEDLWNKLFDIFDKLGYDLRQESRNQSTVSRSTVPGLTDIFWTRLAAVVHEQFPLAGRSLFESKIFMHEAPSKKSKFMKNLILALNKHKEDLSPELSKLELDIVYPQDGDANLADFDIVVWRKLMQYFLPNEQWQDSNNLPTLADLEAFPSKSANHCALVQGLEQFRNYIFRSGCRKMSEEEFSTLWNCMEKMLARLKFDTQQISAYRTTDFDCPCTRKLMTRFFQMAKGDGTDAKEGSTVHQPTQRPATVPRPKGWREDAKKGFVRDKWKAATELFYQPLTSKVVRKSLIDTQNAMRKFFYEVDDSKPNRMLADASWVRLASVVHDHFLSAAIQVFESGIFLAEPHVMEEGFMKKVTESLEKNKNTLLKTLTKLEKEVVYPQSKAVNLANFDIILWAKLMAHIFGHEDWLELDTPATVADMDKYVAAAASQSAFLEGLFHFRSLIFRMGCKKMEEKDFNTMWDCVERLLSGLRYDSTQISAYRTEPFAYSSSEEAIGNSLAVLPRKEEETVYEASDQDRSSSIYESAAAEVLARKEEETVYKVSDQDRSSSIYESAAAEGEKVLSPDSKEGDETGGTNKWKVKAGVVEDKHKGLLFAGVMLFLIAFLYGTSEGIMNVPHSADLHIVLLFMMAIIFHYIGRLKSRSGIMKVLHSTLLLIGLVLSTATISYFIGRLKSRSGIINVPHSAVLHIALLFMIAIISCYIGRLRSRSERKQRAKETCFLVHDRLLKSRELDIFGEQMDGKPKVDMFVAVSKNEISNTEEWERFTEV